MEIFNVKFEQEAVLDINGVKIKITSFQESDPNVIKIGIDAPKSVVVNREEIHLAMLKKQQEEFSL